MTAAIETPRAGTVVYYHATEAETRIGIRGGRAVVLTAPRNGLLTVMTVQEAVHRAHVCVAHEDLCCDELPALHGGAGVGRWSPIARLVSAGQGQNGDVHGEGSCTSPGRPAAVFHPAAGRNFREEL